MANPAAAIIPAAGSGTRMQAAMPKQYLSLAGKPILIHSVSAFISCQEISQIIIVVPSGRQSETETLLDSHQLSRKKISVIAGGARRQDSVLAGLEEVDPDIDIVLVHDGARPLAHHWRSLAWPAPARAGSARPETHARSCAGNAFQLAGALPSRGALP